MAAATQSASSRDRLEAPWWTSGTNRIPVPPTGLAGPDALALGARRGHEPALVEGVRDEARSRPGAGGRSSPAAGPGPGAIGLRAGDEVLRARRPRRPPGACPATPAAAGSGPRAARPIAPRPATRADGGERHLPRLVHEQHVHGAGHVVAGPDPARRRRRRPTGPRRGRPGSPWSRRRRSIPATTARRRRRRPAGRPAASCPPASAALTTCFEQVLDDPVRLCGDADPPPVRDEIEDHPRAGVGLAGPRRPLDREHRVVQPQREDARGGRHVGAVLHQRRALVMAGDPRRQPEDQVAGRPVRTRPFDPVLDHVVGQPQEGIAHRVRLRTACPGSARRGAGSPPCA